MTTAVIPRRMRGTVATSASDSGAVASPSTAARSCMIFRCWRPPRSGWSCARRWAFTVSPTARFSRIALSAIDAAARTATSTVDSSPPAQLGGPVEVEDDPGVGGLLQLELLHLDLAVAGGRLPVDPVERVPGRPRPDGRRERRRLERPLGHRVAPVDVRRRQLPERQRLDPRVDDHRDAGPHGRRRLEEPERIARPDLEWFDRGSGRVGSAGSGRATTAPRSGPSESARPGQARPAARSGCGSPARTSGRGSCSGACR